MTAAISTPIKVIPSARRLVHSLRDLGYDFPQAIADLVDNSVTAGATRVDIDIRFEGPDSWLRIADNGRGMSSDGITEAMRYGSAETYGESDLGKFGLGLKTASLSQCRRLSIASRPKGTRAQTSVRELDLDHVIRTNRWEILSLGRRNHDAKLIQPLSGHGTVVLWQSLDRILSYKDPWDHRAKKTFSALADQLTLHLGMIFHRFLTGEVAGRERLDIKINGSRVEAWDPFASAEEASRELPGTDIIVQSQTGSELVRFQAYVLPPRESFSTEEAFQAAAGPRKWNAQQGFYIYRANRMIQSGGWSRMRALDEHVKLARASIDFFPSLDSAFEVNVAKARVTLPPELREQLQVSVEELVRAAQASYRGNNLEVPAVSSPRHSPLPQDTGIALTEVAKSLGETKALGKIIKRLTETNPRVAKSLGW